jgi:ribosomal protein L7/L12
VTKPTQSPLERFKVVLATICVQHPDMKLADALLLANDVDNTLDELPLAQLAATMPDWTNQEEAAQWIRRDLTCQDLHSKDMKINGIKHIRAISSLGLKEAKDVWELAFGGRAWT